jgi:hypothetical protein
MVAPRMLWLSSLAVSALIALTTRGLANPPRMPLHGLDGALVASPSGQTFPWKWREHTGTVTLKSNFSLMHFEWQYGHDGLGLVLRSTQSPAHPEAFVGTIDLTFDRPVMLGVMPPAGSENLEYFPDYPTNLSSVPGWTGPPKAISGTYEWIEVTSPDAMAPTQFGGSPLRFGALSHGVRFDPKHYPLKPSGGAIQIPMTSLGGYSRNYRITYFNEVTSDLGPESIPAIMARFRGVATAALQPVVVGVAPVPEPSGGFLALIAAGALTAGRAWRHRRRRRLPQPMCGAATR